MWTATSLRFTTIALTLIAAPVLADSADLACVVKAGRNIEARDIALTCGVGEEEVQEILTILQRIEGDAAAQKAQLDRMEALIRALPQSTISDAALVELARRYSRDVADPETAYYELGKAIEVATRLQDEARNNPGTDAFVAEVLRRVAVLNEKAEFDAGAQELDDALALIAAEAENLRQRKVELLEIAVEQDILRRDVESAADRQVALLKLKYARSPTVWEILDIANESYRFALRFGGQYEVEFAIALADRAAKFASSDAESGVVFGSKGNFWSVLGSRGLRPDGLTNSSAAFREALNYFSQDQDAEYWAQTQNNLGAALSEEAIRTAGPEGADLLAEAVTAYRAALIVRTKDDRPWEWAMTQNNLGNALALQGTRTTGPAGADLLAEAVAAFRDALTVRTKGGYPVEWATTQNNLGAALRNQGTRTAGPEGAELLAEAVTAYRAALTVHTKDDYPVSWAMTQENLAIADEAIADHDSTVDPIPHLQAALQNVEDALTVYNPEHTSYFFEKATKLRDRLRDRLDGEG